jgi:hypothetical protein
MMVSILKRPSLPVLSAVLLVAFGGCGGKTKSHYVLAKMSVASYINARISSTAGVETTLKFPLLEIFNAEGRLIYDSQEKVPDKLLLEKVLASVPQRQPLASSPRLMDILNAVPEFRRHEEDILQRHHPVVLSVDLEGCGACRVQARWVDESRDQLLRQSIDVLEIHVSAPFRL